MLRFLFHCSLGSPRRGCRALGAGLIGLSCLVYVGGCGKEPQIEQYVVQREPQPVAEPSSPREPTDRMLGAIIPLDENYWFFKLTGSKAATAPLVEKFGTFMQSVKFSAGPGPSAPSWTLPDGWAQKPGNDFRFATIEIAAEPKPLELAVSKLPRDPAGKDDAALLANVNRWRDQLGLKPLGPTELAAHTKSLPIGATQAILTDFEGTFSGGGMGPMMAGSARSTPPTAPVSPATTPSPSTEPEEPLPFTFVKPATWQLGPVGGLRKLAFQLGGDPKNEVTVIDLDGGLASELLPNVNRWRGQLGLAETTAETLATEAKKLKLGAVQGDYVELLGADKGILGVIVRAGDRGWFFKLAADRATTEKEKGNFEAFMQSVTFP